MPQPIAQQSSNAATTYNNKALPAQDAETHPHSSPAAQHDKDPERAQHQSSIATTTVIQSSISVHQETSIVPLNTAAQHSITTLTTGQQTQQRQQLSGIAVQHHSYNASQQHSSIAV
jgi:hypothetical protein